MIRAAVLAAYAVVAREHGLTVDAEMRAADIDPALLDAPERKLSVVNLDRLLARGADATGNAAFSLAVSRHIDLKRLGLVGLLVHAQPTIGAAIDAVIVHARLHNEAVNIWVEALGTRQAVRQDYVGRAGRPLRHATEMAMGTLFHNLRALADGAWSPSAVCFRHGAPADASRHRALLGTRVEFDADMDAIICRGADFALPNRVYTPDYVATLAHARATGQFDAGGDLVGLAQTVICRLLPSGRCSADAVAAQMGVSRRTLHRWLIARNESFSTLVCSARTEFAVRHLASGQRRLSDVAELLGFGSQADFSNWFRRQFGMTPSEWRRQAAVGKLQP